MKMFPKLLFSLLAVVVLSTASSRALIIQTAPVSFPGTTFQNVTLTFDPWFGSAADLTQVLFKINGTVSGAFGINSAVPFQLNSPELFQSYAFNAVTLETPPPNQFNLQPLATVPPTPGVFPGSTAFVVPTVPVASTGVYDLTAYKDFFLAANLIGTNKVNLSIASWLIINPVALHPDNCNCCNPPTVIGSSMNTLGSVEIVFIPEPSTWALLVASGGVLALGAIRRRRKS